MPPKNKYTREEIIAAAVELTRERGFAAVTARDVGEMLHTSSKPVYTAFENMEELKAEVLLEAERRYQQYVTREQQSQAYLPYKAMGMAYVRFAAEEKGLFRLLYMRDRSGETQEGSGKMTYATAIDTVQTQTGLNTEMAQLFHAEMWIFVHGIATMLATSYMDWDFDLISRMMTDVYNGLGIAIKTEGEEHHEEHH